MSQIHLTTLGYFIFLDYLSFPHTPAGPGVARYYVL